MRKKTTSILFIFACVLLIGYCAWQIITTLQERYLSKQEYEKTRESYVSAIHVDHEEEKTEDHQDSTPSEEPVDIDPFPQFNVDIYGLLQQNPDFACWIYYQDGEVSYPVAQETKAELNKYMTTTFDNKPNPSGCVFIAYDADSSFRYMNNFIYGHNMANGSMFGTLKKVYQKPEEARDPYIYIWTKEHEVIRYRVFAVYVTDHESDMFSIPLTESDYQEYIRKAMTYGAFNKYVLFTDAEKEAIKSEKPIITLSTCYGAAGTTKRLLVQAVEIERRSVN